MITLNIKLWGNIPKEMLILKSKVQKTVNKEHQIICTVIKPTDTLCTIG